MFMYAIRPSLSDLLPLQPDASTTGHAADNRGESTVTDAPHVARRIDAGHRRFQHTALGQAAITGTGQSPEETLRANLLTWLKKVAQAIETERQNIIEIPVQARRAMALATEIDSVLKADIGNDSGDDMLRLSADIYPFVAKFIPEALPEAWKISQQSALGRADLEALRELLNDYKTRELRPHTKRQLENEALLDFLAYTANMLKSVFELPYLPKLDMYIDRIRKPLASDVMHSQFPRLAALTEALSEIFPTAYALQPPLADFICTQRGASNTDEDAPQHRMPAERAEPHGTRLTKSSATHRGHIPMTSGYVRAQFPAPADLASPSGPRQCEPAAVSIFSNAPPVVTTPPGPPPKIVELHYPELAKVAEAIAWRVRRAAKNPGEIDADITQFECSPLALLSGPQQNQFFWTPFQKLARDLYKASPNSIVRISSSIRSAIDAAYPRKNTNRHRDADFFERLINEIEQKALPPGHGIAPPQVTA